MQESAVDNSYPLRIKSKGESVSNPYIVADPHLYAAIYGYFGEAGGGDLSGAKSDLILCLSTQPKRKKIGNGENRYGDKKTFILY